MQTAAWMASQIRVDAYSGCPSLSSFVASLFGLRLQKYPTTLETIAFSSTTATADGPSLPARTADGLAISLQIGFNYQIRNSYEDILSLYLNYGSADNVDVLYQRIAKNVVRTVAANYPAASFFVSQETIRDAMSRQLATELDSRRATLSGFNFLGAIGVPAALSSAITRQQSAQQDKTKAEQDLQTTRINAAARVDANRTAATLIVTGAINNASQTVQRVDAQIASLAARYSAERTSYQALKAALNMTVPELLAYVWLDAQAEANVKGAGSTVMAIKRPSALSAAP